jgi:tRNA(Ile)-lysidine synthase
MHPFEKHVQDVIARHGLLRAEDRVLVGVSGGADSVGLLLVLRQLGYAVSVAHLNHGLRGAESDEDERFVGQLANTLAVPLFTRRVQLSTVAGNLEALGRQARKDFFEDLLRQHGFNRIALAHTRDDRIETFLLNLFRGSGVEGLVAMPALAGRVVRPLLECSRKDVERYLQQRGESWRTDSSNFDMSFLRNRLRHEIVPRVASLFNSRLPEALERTMALLSDENQYLQKVADDVLGHLGTRHSATEYSLDARLLHEQPKAIVRRLLRSALREVRPNLEDITFDHLEAVQTLLEEGKSGKTIELPGGLQVWREFGQLRIGATPEPAVEFRHVLPIPGSVHVPELRRTFRAVILDARNATFAGNVLADAARIGSSVTVRNWKPGDYYRPEGWPAGKVKKLFQRARVPRRQRGRWPVFEAKDGIAWVESFPVSREFAPRSQTEKIVAFEALQA